MPKIKLILDKDICINCGSCIPEGWDTEKNTSYFMEQSRDGVHINNIPPKFEGNEEVILEVNDTQLKNIKNAVAICPVKCIHVENL